MRWGHAAGVGGAIAAIVAVSASCDDIDREPSNRYYIPPDAGADVARTIPDAAVSDADAETLLDASDDADADAAVTAQAEGEEVIE